MSKPYLKSTYRRTPRNYSGTEVTSHLIGELLPSVLSGIGAVYEQRPDLILAVWPSIIGPQLAPMTQAVSFIEGVLVVKVKNSTLHSLLSQKERPRILQILRQRFPNVDIKSILFRMS
jgi:hypothetical protein